MKADHINPILLIDISIDSEEHRSRIEAHLRVLEQNHTGAIAVQRTEQHIVLVAEDELDLETACHRLAESIPTQFGELRIAYCETIRKTAEAEGKYIRQTGGSGNYAHCRLRIEPSQLGKVYKFVNEIKSGMIPANYVQSIGEGIQSAMEGGILAGFPMTDLTITLVDGSYHDTDSNDMAFKFAGSIAFKEAARKASPVLLEPVMAIEVTVLEEFKGTIIAGINARRGRIEQMDQVDRRSAIAAIVPLAEVLRSSPRGRPEYSMRFAGYQEVPRPNDRGDGDTPVPSLRPRGGNPRTSSATQPDPDG